MPNIEIVIIILGDPPVRDIIIRIIKTNSRTTQIKLTNFVCRKAKRSMYIVYHYKSTVILFFNISQSTIKVAGYFTFSYILILL